MPHSFFLGQLEYPPSQTLKSMPHSFFLGQLKCQPISVTDEHVSFFLLGANWIPTISVTDGHASFFLLGATWNQPIPVTDGHSSFFLLGATWNQPISVTDGHASFFLLGATWTPTYLSQWSAFIVLSSRGNFNTHFGRPFCLPFLFFSVWGVFKPPSHSSMELFFSSLGQLYTNLSQVLASLFLLSPELLRCSSILFSSSV